MDGKDVAVQGDFSDDRVLDCLALAAVARDRGLLPPGGETLADAAKLADHRRQLGIAGLSRDDLMQVGYERILVPPGVATARAVRAFEDQEHPVGCAARRPLGFQVGSHRGEEPAGH